MFRKIPEQSSSEENREMKKILWVLILALQFTGAVSVATAEAPFPECFPCPPKPGPTR
jgi:flagellar basal body-associated protein FliL